jgi:hypothetical protein
VVLCEVIGEVTVRVWRRRTRKANIVALGDRAKAESRRGKKAPTANCTRTRVSDEFITVGIIVAVTAYLVNLDADIHRPQTRDILR